MKWSLQQLQKIANFPFLFEAKYDFKKNLDKKEDVLDIGLAHVKGTITRIADETYEFDYDVDVSLTMACSLTLEPVEFHLQESFNEVYSTTENDDWYKIEKNAIDLEEMVWTNIVMALPIRIVREDAYQILEKRGIVLSDMPNDEE